MAGEKALLMDVGNTNTKFAIADQSGLDGVYGLPTDVRQTPDGWGFRILDVCRAQGLAPGDLALVAACSVSPQVDGPLSMACERFLDQRLRFVPRDIPLALDNRFGKPSEVGADRLVAAYGAHMAHPGKKIIVVDFGTATTFDCVDGAAHVGGLICPGLMSSLAALAGNTAKLPRISLAVDADAPDIGTDTLTCLNHGMVFGFAAMVEGLAKRLSKKMGGHPLVLATGGFADNLARVCPAIDEVRPDLLMEGLRLAVFAGDNAK